MRKSNSDTSKVRQVLESHGYNPRGRFYSESRKNHRRVKAWICEVEIQDLDLITQDLQEVFGDRFVCCYNMLAQSYFRPFLSFIVELTPFTK